MAVDIKQLELLYFTNNKPVPYVLKCGVEIFIRPISVGNWGEFNDALTCITIRKEEIGSSDVLQMKYLDFLLSLCFNDDTFMKKLKTIVKYSLSEEYISVHLLSGKNNLAIVDNENTIKYLINAKEFDDIKNIILFQNICDYDDRYISPDVRKAIEDYEKIKNKNIHYPSLEKKKIFVMSMNGISEEKLNRMSYRSFSQIYNSLISRDIYFIQNIIKASPKYEIKEEVIHPEFRMETDRLGASFIEKDVLEKKIH